MPVPVIEAPVKLNGPTLLRLNVLSARAPGVAIDKVPNVEISVPNVVVPPLTVRLLNVVNIVDGSVFAAVNTTLPLPGIQALVTPALLTVIPPPILRVPPADISITLGVPGVPPAFPNVRLPAVTAEPFEKTIVPDRVATPKPPTVTLPETVIEKAPEKFNIPAPLLPGLPI